MANLSENINRAIADFDSIKTSIEDKGVTVGTVPTSQYAEKIREISDDSQPILIEKNITENGIYNSTDDNADGYSNVTVDVPSSDPYEVMNEYVIGTLQRLRLNNVPPGNLRVLTPGGNSSIMPNLNLQSIELPNNTDGLSTWQFGKLQGLVRFDAGFCGNFANVCLTGCQNLRELIIRKSDSCATLYNTVSVSFESTGKIYVPPNLIEDYKVATNWTAHAARFRKLYFANSDAEKDTLLADSTIDIESMIVCDYNETYVIKE